MAMAKDILLGLTSLSGSDMASNHFKSINLTGPITIVNNQVKFVDKYIINGKLDADVKSRDLSADIIVTETSVDKLSQDVSANMSIAGTSSFIS